MGIQVRKMMGYGLTDVVVKKGKISDPRFAISKLNYDEEELSFNNFLKWLEKEKDNRPVQFDCNWLIYHIKERGEEINFYNCFNYDFEFGLKGVICFIPIVHLPEWYRIDDAIDYYYETKILKSHDAHVETWDTPIYPYLNFWDVRDGRKISDVAFDFWRAYNEDMDVNSLAELCGFKNTEECLQFMKPVVPPNLQLLLEYAKIFKNNETIRELRPMIYTYWS